MPPDPRPVQPSAVLARSRDAARRLRRCRRSRGGILDCRCARRSATNQVGSKGWSFPIEQRDAPLSDLNEPPPPTITNLLNLTHTTVADTSPGCSTDKIAWVGS